MVGFVETKPIVFVLYKSTPITIYRLLFIFCKIILLYDLESVIDKQKNHI